MKRARIFIKGVVQGIGFRPYIYRLAGSLGLKGYVFNSREGVEIEIEGKEKNVQEFLKLLEKNAPQSAIFTQKKIEFLKQKGYNNFKIKESRSTGEKNILLPADISLCKKCFKEVFDKKDRRYLYPFINCTDCGPRFTIIKDLPYDRKNTTMEPFKMCKDCASEYSHPLTRRYHAQPNACEICGPKVSLYKGSKLVFQGKAALSKASSFLQNGRILAVKGIGGYNLMCDAFNNAAAKFLRSKKQREYKPFALMARDIGIIKKYCYVSDKEKTLLESSAHPIVLLKKKNINSLQLISPDNNYLGVMLAYSALHHILLKDIELVVATSANFKDEPLISDDSLARKALNNIADYLLTYNRDIHAKCDDSITQIVSGKPAILRRARGYVPLPVMLDKKNSLSVLGCGAELKNTFCLTKGGFAFLSQHIGDLKNIETFDFYKNQINHFKNMFSIKPKIVVCDLHPDYLSTRFALQYKKNNPDVKLIQIQHHYAHILSVMAEHKIKKKIIGVAFDGIGYGSDGHIWGSEFMLADLKGFKRKFHFKYVLMPGGDKATEETWRMGLSYLYDAFGKELKDLKIPFVKKHKEKINSITKMIENKINSPLSSSAGRFFDAVSSILGICNVSTYEAQGAIELQREAENSGKVGTCYKFEIKNDIIETSDIIKQIVRDIRSNISRKTIALKFHNTIAKIILDVCKILKKEYNIDNVALSGGVFQNKLLTELILKDKNFKFFINEQVPTNDGGIALGQVYYSTEYRVQSTGCAKHSTKCRVQSTE